jgi:ribosomal protein S18 acetylase RimI-like enzyme
MHITVQRYTSCTDRQSAAFLALAAAGGEVPIDYIKSGVARAKALLWIEDNGSMVAVAAVKVPLPSYRRGTFNKAKVLGNAQFPLEIGYICVDANHRRKGYGKALVEMAVEIAGADGIFATTRTNNDGMKTILEDAGFRLTGQAYPSSEDLARLLCLHLRAGS